MDVVFASNSSSRCYPGAEGRQPDVIFGLADAVESTIKSSADDETKLCASVARGGGCASRDRAWIPTAVREPRPEYCRRELFFEASDGSFSIVCFLRGPGQRGPIRDHRGWSVMDCAFGAVESQSYDRSPSDSLLTRVVHTLLPGACHWRRRPDGNIHSMYAIGGRAAVSVRVYGCRFSEVPRLRYSASRERVTQ